MKDINDLDHVDAETLAAIDEGLRDIEAGRVVPAEEVRELVKKWISAHEEKERKSDAEITVNAWASWGAAVLRPYNILPRIGDRLRSDRVGFFGIDAEVLDGFVEDFGLEFAVEVQLVQRGERDAARVDFEEGAQGLAAFAAAEAVGAERCETPRQPLADHVGQRLQIVGRRDEHAGRIAERLGDVWYARLRAGCNRFQRSVSMPSV